MKEKVQELLKYWFGDVGTADLPTSDRTNLWFGENEVGKQHLVNSFRTEYNDAITGKLEDWGTTPRGRLALIILLDQFSRHIHKGTKDAFLYDEQAQAWVKSGIEEKMDHSLTLIERVFFYMPLVHAENEAYQEKSIRLYQELVTLSMPETTQIYQLFLAYAYAHFRVVKEFGRFPQRNVLLGRETTADEYAFLKNT